MPFGFWDRRGRVRTAGRTLSERGRGVRMVPRTRTVPCTVRTTRYVPLISIFSDQHIFFFFFSSPLWHFLFAFVAFFFRLCGISLCGIHRLCGISRLCGASSFLWWLQDIHLAPSQLEYVVPRAPPHNESEPGTGGLIVPQDRAQQV